MKKEDKIRTALLLFLTLVLFPVGAALYSAAGFFSSRSSGESNGAYEKLGSDLPVIGAKSSDHGYEYASAARPDAASRGSSKKQKSEIFIAPPVTICSFYGASSSSKSASPAVIFSEIAWMGGAQSSNNEWIELATRSKSPVDISGWQLIDKREQIKIVIKPGTRLTADAPYYLLERTNDDAVSGIGADEVYVGALSNSDEGLRLFDQTCNLIDEAEARTSWPAGDASHKRTMERNFRDLSWHTYGGAADVISGLFGTPRAINSMPVEK